MSRLQCLHPSTSSIPSFDFKRNHWHRRHSSRLSGSLTGSSITLKDGAAGTGTGNIGTSGAPIQINGGITANTTGNVYLNSIDSSGVSLGASSAGSTNTFSLTSSPSLSNASINLSGAVNAGTINITASNGGSSSINGSGVLTATNVDLNSGVGGQGAGSISVTTVAQFITVNTQGQAFVTVTHKGLQSSGCVDWRRRLRTYQYCRWWRQCQNNNWRKYHGWWIWSGTSNNSQWKRAGRHT